MSVKTFFRAYLRKPTHKTIYKDETIKETLCEILWFLVLLITVNILAFSRRLVLMYYFTNTIDRLFMNRGFLTTGEIELNYHEIVTIDDWWNYMQNPFMYAIYSEGTLHEELQTKKANMTDKKQLEGENLYLLRSSIFLGPPRIRQLKVRNDSCPIHPAFKRYFQQCFDQYSYWNELRIKGEIDNVGDFAWGQLSFYRGGGYTKYMKVGKEANENLLEQLKNTQWIELGTRFIAVEFNLYNANSNLFCMVKLFAELPSIGGVITSSSIRTFQMLDTKSAYDIFIIIVKILFLLQIIIFTIREAALLYEMGCKYFLRFWNWITFILLLMGYFILIFTTIRHFWMLEIIDQYNKAPNQYIDMDHIILAQYYVSNVMGICVFLVWIQIFKYMAFNKTMLQFTLTLRRCAGDLFGFAVMFFIVFLAFAQLGYLLFGTVNPDFRTLTDSIFTMMRTILGDFQYLAIEQANRILGPMFFIAYIFFVFFVLLNMFLAIINDTYSEVKSETFGDDIQICNFLKKMLAKFCKCLCCGRSLYKYEEPSPKASEELPVESAASSKKGSNSRLLNETKTQTENRSEFPTQPQRKIVVRRRDLIPKLFKEIAPDEWTAARNIPNIESIQTQLDDVEGRLHNLEMLMDNFISRMDTLINRLDTYDSEGETRNL